LISRRVYKPAFTHEEAIDIMRKGRGTHFDPDILDVFLKITDEFKEIAMRYQEGEGGETEVF
jgi:putative two-component system response regulator